MPASIQRGIHPLACQSPRFAASLRAFFFPLPFLSSSARVAEKTEKPFVKSRRKRDKTLFAPDTRVPPQDPAERSFRENSPRLIIIRRRISARRVIISRRIKSRVFAFAGIYLLTVTIRLYSLSRTRLIHAKRGLPMQEIPGQIYFNDRHDLASLIEFLRSSYLLRAPHRCVCRQKKAEWLLMKWILGTSRVVRPSCGSSNDGAHR